MGKRQESDYDDFQHFSKEDILPLFEEVQNFLAAIRDLKKK
jgi:hypothetical protein